MTESLDPSGDQWEIRQLVESYAAAADRADGEAAAALFTDNGEFEVWLDPTSEESRSMRGHAAIAAAVGRTSSYRATHHSISSCAMTIDGDRAAGETRCIAHHVEVDGRDSRDRVMYIRYDEALVRVDARWRFTRRELHVEWVSIQPVESI